VGGGGGAGGKPSKEKAPADASLASISWQDEGSSLPHPAAGRALGNGNDPCGCRVLAPLLEVLPAELLTIGYLTEVSPAVIQPTSVPALLRAMAEVEEVKEEEEGEAEAEAEKAAALEGRGEGGGEEEDSDDDD